MTKRLPDSHTFDVRFCRPFIREARVNPTSFIRSEPARLLRPIRQIENGRDPENNRGRPFHEKNPAPAGEIQPMDTENAASDRSSNHEANWNRRHETRDRFAAIRRCKPVGKINDHAWKKSGFGR